MIENHFLISALRILKSKENQILTGMNIAHEMGGSIHPVDSEVNNLACLKKALFQFVFNFFMETITG